MQEREEKIELEIVREREGEKERMIERHRKIEGESGRKRDREIMSVNDSCKEGSTILNLTSDICSSMVP